MWTCNKYIIYIVSKIKTQIDIYRTLILGKSKYTDKSVNIQINVA